MILWEEEGSDLDSYRYRGSQEDNKVVNSATSIIWITKLTIFYDVLYNSIEKVLL